jgi:hypothetical protein
MSNQTASYTTRPHNPPRASLRGTPTICPVHPAWERLRVPPREWTPLLLRPFAYMLSLPAPLGMDTAKQGVGA